AASVPTAPRLLLGATVARSPRESALRDRTGAPQRRKLARLHRGRRRRREPRRLVLPHVLPLGHLARVLADRLRDLGSGVFLGHFLVDHATAIDVATPADR